MRKRSFPYRHEDGFHLIEIRLSDPRQLFNSLDPAPFVEKDLDADAEEYIVDAVRELRGRKALKLVFHLPADRLGEAAALNIREAVHRYFAYRESVTWRRLRDLFRRGWIALGIGLTVLFAALSARHLPFLPPTGHWREVAEEALFIIGWVAMWQPAQIFLYDWWPLWRLGRIHRRLSRIPIEVRAVAPLMQGSALSEATGSAGRPAEAASP